LVGKKKFIYSPDLRFNKFKFIHLLDLSIYFINNIKYK
jgi:hypothetical protein